MPERFGRVIDARIDHVIDLYQNMPALFLVLLVPVGLIYLFLGVKIYRIVLGIAGVTAGGAIGYHVSGQLPLTLIMGTGLGALMIFLQFLFMFVLSGLTFGGIAFASVFAFYRSDLSLFAAIAFSVIGICLASLVFRFAVIITTAAIGAIAIIYPVFLLIHHGRLTGTFDMTLIAVEPMYVAIGFCSLWILGITAQSVIWGVRKPVKGY